MSIRSLRGGSSGRVRAGLGPARRKFALAGALALVASACQSSDEARPFGLPAELEAPAAEGFGSLVLPLISAGGDAYRLRTAVFEVERATLVVASLSSDADPDAAELSAALTPGTYQLRLHTGWVLEPLAQADAGVEPLRAALISPNPVGFTVRNARATTVAFTFTTNTGTLALGEGSVSVRLGVADPASLGSCDARAQSGCDAGQHCLFSGDGAQTFCATPGDLPVGASCSSEQCVLGAQCLGLDPGSAASRCTELCDPAAPPFGCDCRGLLLADDVGVCGPPPPTACDLLDPASCPTGQACQYPGGSFGVCGTPGSATEGEACFGEECSAGLDCFGDDPGLAFSGTCYRFCDLLAPDCEFCFDVGTGSVGRCFF